MSFIEHSTDATYEADLAGSDLPVMVDFWAPWCAPCRAMGKTLEEVASEFEGKVRILKVNVDENQETAGRFGVQSIPTLLFYRDGDPIGAIPGALSAPALREVLTRHGNGTLGKEKERSKP